jgi:streptogrisin C
MLHRRAMGAGAAVAAVGALILAALQGAAAGSTPPTTAPAQSGTAAYPAGMLKAMQRDLGLTAAQARTRLADESRAGAVAGRLHLALGHSYAGSWVSGTTAQLTVATSDPAEAESIEAKGADAVVVGHSLARLDAAKAALDRAAHRKAPAGVPVWYVDARANTVTLLSSRPAAARDFAAEAGVDRGLVTVKRSSLRPEPLADLRGGDAYYINGNTRCSIGFPVTRGGQGGFVSAGHCGRPGSTTTGSNQQSLGTFQGSTFPGHDYSWVAANSSWTPRPIVNGYGTGDKNVAGSTEAVEGASVCRSGSTTGWHCGTVQQRNTSVTYQEGTVSPVTRTNVCAEPGDSGGSFISGSQAQGVTSGGSGNCSSGGTTFFQPVNAALSAYGVTLVTNGGGGSTPPTTPPPGGGTWAAGTVYHVGDTVTYGGGSYRCLQGHQALPGWEPPNTPALWQAL